MSGKTLPTLRAIVVAAGFTLGACAAQAALLATLQAQPNLFNSANPAPPTLTEAMQNAIGTFNTGVTVLGGNEFEGGGASQPALNFSYGTGSTASLSGALGLVNGFSTDLSLGRYNLTTGLAPVGGIANPGHWVEANGNFTFAFSSAVSAFSFFATDLGDYGGSLSVQFLKSGNALLNYDFARGGSDGDLRFFGVKGDGSDADRFDSIVFTLAGGGADLFGFDSVRVGSVAGAGPGPGPGPGPDPDPGPGDIPEPGSLALTGLALAAAGLVARRRKHG